MQESIDAYPILTVLIIATASSILAELPLPFRVPVIVWEIIFGVIIGPHLLGLARPIGSYTRFGQLHFGIYNLLGERGLAALFFMAGLDLDLRRVEGRPLNLAISGWVISLGLGLAAAVLLRALPFVHAPLMITLALSTTALGTFMPALHDAGMLETDFGTQVLSAGAAGEFLPIICASLILTREFPAGRRSPLCSDLLHLPP